MQFSVLHIQFPELQEDDLTTDAPQLNFNVLTNFTMPRCRIIELHILDPKKRMIGILFLCHDTGTIGLYMIFDWESGQTVMTNTGLPFVSFVTALSTTDRIYKSEINSRLVL